MSANVSAPLSGVPLSGPHPLPWRYEPQGDSDGEVIGVDHYVTDAAGEPVVLCGDEGTARLIVAAVCGVMGKQGEMR